MATYLKKYDPAKPELVHVPRVAKTSFAFSDFSTGGAVVDLFYVAPDTLITGLAIHVTTAHNGTGTPTATVGDSDSAARLAASSDVILKTLGGYVSPSAVHRYTAAQAIQATLTYDGAATAGAMDVYLTYIPKASML